MFLSNYRQKKLSDYRGFLIAVSVLFVLLFYFSFSCLASSPDAIAIRVVPINEHYSPLTWYKKNIKVQGSPQSLQVDGYEAVRDGRTVYVNAANISGDNLYTNIYIISYNQEAEDLTIDIFGQILAHWKFNANSEINSSQKQKIIRDVKRLANLYDMNLALANYKKDSFPLLKSGSYITGASVSTWPSWQATLGKELNITMPIDPINKLGACPAGYDTKTCWNQTAKLFHFHFDFPSIDSQSISKFPIYWYKDGVFYAGLETDYNVLPAVANISLNVITP